MPAESVPGPVLMVHHRYCPDPDTPDTWVVPGEEYPWMLYTWERGSSTDFMLYALGDHEQDGDWATDTLQLYAGECRAATAEEVLCFLEHIESGVLPWMDQTAVFEGIQAHLDWLVNNA